MRLIDADMAIEVADAVWTVTGDTNVAKVWQQIKDLPTVDPVRHGKWIDEGYYADHTSVKAWHCSECNWHMLGYSDELFRYCPMCGTRMGEDETY